ncbi:hypothetical protein [Micromonospora yangpuensis]|uniref:hypothetical protein n=1 Tax=Micromonospora yangpuensis TaxID=683228 RepID=UPI0019A3A080|nr:hypothetical protein [Micromonospora yangpuensis]GGM30184.1 hypothetical protein GCM10012279_56400 [Micromonospora yangpuensis]
MEMAEFPYHVTVTPDELAGLVRTRSHYLVAEAPQRQIIDDGVRDLLATHPDLAGRERIELPYRTFVFRAPRAGAPASWG